MKAVLIAGGLGTRLRPVTHEIPKPLIPIQGRALIEHNIDLLKDAGVTEVYVAIGYMAEKIQLHLGNSYNGIEINFLVEKEPLGTGGWMNLSGRIKGDFFAINADNLFDVDLKSMLSFHRKNHAAATIALTKVENVSAFGIAALEGEKITKFVEKPRPEEAPSRFANSGYYIFNEKIFDHIPKKESFMLEKEVFPSLAKNNLLCGFKSEAQWFDTGTFEAWERAIKEWRIKR